MESILPSSEDIRPVEYTASLSVAPEKLVVHHVSGTNFGLKNENQFFIFYLL